MAPFIRVGQTQIDAKKYGLAGDGQANDAPAWSAMLTDIPDGSDVHFDGAPTFLLVNGVRPTMRRGLRLVTNRMPHPDGVNVPTLLYDGKPGGTVLELDRCLSCEISGFAIVTDDRESKRAPASRAIALDGGQDTGGSGYGSECLLKDLLLLANQPHPDLKQIAIAERTKWNQELHRIVNVHAQGNGAGSFLFMGPSYNTKNLAVEHCTAAGFDKAVWMKNGSIDLQQNNFNFNTWNLYLEGASGSCREGKSITEASQHHAYYNVPIEISACDFDPSHVQPRDAYIYFMQGLESLELRNSAFSNMPAARGATLYRFSNDASHRQIALRGNRYPWVDPAGATLELIGLDLATLRGKGHPEKQVGQLVLEGERGIADLPSGCMRFNAPRVTAYAQGFMERDRSS